MSVAGIHRGFLRKYGGFMFKQWKERYLILTADGCVLVSRDAVSPPDQMVALQGGCEAIVEGREILDLPKLPSGGRRDCCFALILPQEKFLLLLADNAEECSQWVNMLRKVRESVSSPMSSCRRHNASTRCITDRDPLPDPISDKDPPTPPLSDMEILSPGPRYPGPRSSGPRSPGPRSPGPTSPGLISAGPNSPGPTTGDIQQKENGQKSPHMKRDKGTSRSVGCLRHGTSHDAQAVRAVYLLMGGAAASSAMGYLGACSPANPDVRPPDLPPSTDFSNLGSAGAYHSCNQTVVDSPHFHSFDFEGADSDFDAFDCGGFSF
uniref:uncharacterized protein LOC124007565 n=1 Tax=Oncorhynchus gorbuscha TaxID=8017 RepID=UPI001EAEC264|nr:uncharacterized protein LOC124007565 [Oncorhynchus gorbuscha]